MIEGDKRNQLGLDKNGYTLYALLRYSGVGEKTGNSGRAKRPVVCNDNAHKRISANRYYSNRKNLTVAEQDLSFAVVSHYR